MGISNRSAVLGICPTILNALASLSTKEKERKGRLPGDLEPYDGIFFVSKALKAVIEALDPGACDIRPCDTVLSSGEPGPELWLCSVTRAFIEAIDFEHSAISASFLANNPGRSPGSAGVAVAV